MVSRPPYRAPHSSSHANLKDIQLSRDAGVGAIGPPPRGYCFLKTIRNERTVCTYGVSFWADAQSICYLPSSVLKELPIPIQGDSKARRKERDRRRGPGPKVMHATRETRSDASHISGGHHQGGILALRISFLFPLRF